MQVVLCKSWPTSPFSEILRQFFQDHRGEQDRASIQTVRLIGSATCFAVKEGDKKTVWFFLSEFCRPESSSAIVQESVLIQHDNIFQVAAQVHQAPGQFVLIDDCTTETVVQVASLNNDEGRVLLTVSSKGWLRAWWSPCAEVSTWTQFQATMLLEQANTSILFAWFDVNSSGRNFVLWCEGEQHAPGHSFNVSVYSAELNLRNENNNSGRGTQESGQFVSAGIAQLHFQVMVAGLDCLFRNGVLWILHQSHRKTRLSVLDLPLGRLFHPMSEDRNASLWEEEESEHRPHLVTHFDGSPYDFSGSRTTRSRRHTLLRCKDSIQYFEVTEQGACISCVLQLPSRFLRQISQQGSNHGCMQVYILCESPTHLYLLFILNGVRIEFARVAFPHTSNSTGQGSGESLLLTVEVLTCPVSLANHTKSQLMMDEKRSWKSSNCNGGSLLPLSLIQYHSALWSASGKSSLWTLEHDFTVRIPLLHSKFDVFAVEIHWKPLTLDSVSEVLRSFTRLHEIFDTLFQHRAKVPPFQKPLQAFFTRGIQEKFDCYGDLRTRRSFLSTYGGHAVDSNDSNAALEDSGEALFRLLQLSGDVLEMKEVALRLYYRMLSDRPTVDPDSSADPFEHLLQDVATWRPLTFREFIFVQNTMIRSFVQVMHLGLDDCDVPVISSNITTSPGSREHRDAILEEQSAWFSLQEEDWFGANVESWRKNDDDDVSICWTETLNVVTLEPRVDMQLFERMSSVIQPVTLMQLGAMLRPENIAATRQLPRQRGPTTTAARDQSVYMVPDTPSTDDITEDHADTMQSPILPTNVARQLFTPLPPRIATFTPSQSVMRTPWTMPKRHSPSHTFSHLHGDNNNTPPAVHPLLSVWHWLLLTQDGNYLVPLCQFLLQLQHSTAPRSKSISARRSTRAAKKNTHEELDILNTEDDESPSATPFVRQLHRKSSVHRDDDDYGKQQQSEDGSESDNNSTDDEDDEGANRALTMHSLWPAGDASPSMRPLAVSQQHRSPAGAVDLKAVVGLNLFSLAFQPQLWQNVGAPPQTQSQAQAGGVYSPAKRGDPAEASASLKQLSHGQQKPKQQHAELSIRRLKEKPNQQKLGGRNTSTQQQQQQKRQQMSKWMLSSWLEDSPDSNDDDDDADDDADDNSGSDDAESTSPSNNNSDGSSDSSSPGELLSGDGVWKLLRAQMFAEHYSASPVPGLQTQRSLSDDSRAEYSEIHDDDRNAEEDEQPQQGEFVRDQLARFTWHVLCLSINGTISASSFMQNQHFELTSKYRSLSIAQQDAVLQAMLLASRLVDAAHLLIKLRRVTTLVRLALRTATSSLALKRLLVRQETFDPESGATIVCFSWRTIAEALRDSDGIASINDLPAVGEWSAQDLAEIDAFYEKDDRHLLSIHTFHRRPRSVADMAGLLAAEVSETEHAHHVAAKAVHRLAVCALVLVDDSSGCDSAADRWTWLTQLRTRRPLHVSGEEVKRWCQEAVRALSVGHNVSISKVNSVEEAIRRQFQSSNL